MKETYKFMKVVKLEQTLEDKLMSENLAQYILKKRLTRGE